MTICIRNLGFGVILALSLTVFLAAQATVSQPPVVRDPFGNASKAMDPAFIRMRALQEHRLREQNYRQMLQDADRIVALSREFETSARQHEKPTPDDLKKLQEIEKLSRGIRERMAR